MNVTTYNLNGCPRVVSVPVSNATEQKAAVLATMRTTFTVYYNDNLDFSIHVVHERNDGTSGARVASVIDPKRLIHVLEAVVIHQFKVATHKDPYANN